MTLMTLPSQHRYLVLWLLTELYTDGAPTARWDDAEWMAIAEETVAEAIGALEVAA